MNIRDFYIIKIIENTIYFYYQNNKYEVNLLKTKNSYIKKFYFRNKYIYISTATEKIYYIKRCGII